MKDHFNASFSKDFREFPDRWQKGKIPAHERRKLFTVWVGDAVDALMLRRDIIRRAFRGTGVGIDVEGKEKGCLRLPRYETYEGPEIDGEHNDSELTDAELKAMQKGREVSEKEEEKACRAAGRG